MLLILSKEPKYYAHLPPELGVKTPTYMNLLDITLVLLTPPKSIPACIDLDLDLKNADEGIARILQHKDLISNDIEIVSIMSPCNLETFKPFCEFLTECRDLKIIKLSQIFSSCNPSNNQLEHPEHLKECFKTLPNCPSLNELNLHEIRFNNLDDATFDAFCDMLPKCRHLQKLILRTTDITKLSPTRFRKLFEAIGKCNLIRLDIINTEILRAPTAQFSIFCQTLLKWPNLNTLVLDGFIVYHMDAQNFKMFYDTLLQLKQLTSVDFALETAYTQIEPLQAFAQLNDLQVQLSDLESQKEKKLAKIKNRFAFVENATARAHMEYDSTQALHTKFDELQEPLIEQISNLQKQLVRQVLDAKKKALAEAEAQGNNTQAHDEVMTPLVLHTANLKVSPPLSPVKKVQQLIQQMAQLLVEGGADKAQAEEIETDIETQIKTLSEKEISMIVTRLGTLEQEHPTSNEILQFSYRCRVRCEMALQSVDNDTTGCRVS